MTHTTESMADAENPLAFPSVCLGDPSHPASTPGMTLRDWFAGQALIGLATVHHGNDWGPDGKGHGPICASKAYNIADAMLAVRETLRRQS